MSIVDSILNIFLGDKGKKDIKEVSPIVDSILSYEKEIKDISNDELRSVTDTFKSEIKSLKKPFYDEIDKVKKLIENSEDIEQNEANYKEIEKIEGSYLDKLDEYLNSIIPKAFAVVKETTKRFKENTEIKVKTNEFDEKLSVHKPYIKIEKNTSIWSNSWDAAGKSIIWDMVCLLYTSDAADDC